MSAAGPWVIVPIKPFASAKRRLARALDPPQRTHLARVMAEDVLDALAASMRFLAGAIVVTSDADAVALARDRGIRVLVESEPAGINRALQCVITLLPNVEAGIVIVPSDLPQITSKVFERLADLLATPPAAVLVPATSDQGTNVFACRPANAVSVGFGRNSFARHLQRAKSVGLEPNILVWPELGCDIDRPDDLAAFLSLQTSTRTHEFLLRCASVEKPASTGRRNGLQGMALIQ